jgi:cyclophilin family peptidyl-prolyl cis-trans isomerase
MTSGGWRGRISCAIGRLLGQSGRDASLESLEARSLLSDTPLPMMDDLEAPNNTVIRLETNFGDIDLELFNSAAPITVANLINYVTSGRLDNTLFHRSAFSSGNPFVLQGGGFTIEDGVGITRVSTDAPIVREATGRGNLERTVAMARTTDPNSATNQFFINYVDNTFLDTSGGGYAVFGRVIQGWNVVLAIQALRSLDLAAVSPFTTGDGQGIGGEVPVSANYVVGQPFTEANAVILLNAEIIKPANMTGFFAQQLVMPEGFRSGATVENLEISNPNSLSAAYQVIIRYETGIRDTVIASGLISANTSLQVRLSDFANSGLNVVRSNTPYAVVVQTALPETATNIQPVSASINRVDFASDTGEGLFNAAGYSDAALRDWLFPRIERNLASREFLTWVNLNENTAVITVDFVTSGGTVTVTRTLEGYRRGGLEVFNLGLAAGNMSARVRSTQNIVAYLSDWDLPAQVTTTPSSFYTPGFGVMGLPGGGLDAAGLADAFIQANSSNTLSIFNPGSSAAVVTLSFWRTSRPQGQDPITAVRTIFAGGREDYALDAGTLGIPLDEHFAVTYTSGSSPVAVQWTSVIESGRNQPVTGSKPDGVATLLSGMIAPAVHFTDGGYDVNRTDGSMVERISIFNPFADSAVAFTYTVRYTFSDGTVIDAFTGSLGANARADLLTSNSTAVRNKIGSNTQFRRYAISVTGQGVEGSTTTNAAGLVTFTRLDSTLGRSIASTGSMSALGLGLDDPIFQAG